MRFVCILFCGLMVPAALAQDTDRPNLAGKWQIDPARSEGGSGVTLNIETKDDSLHWVQAGHNGEIAEFNCTTDGKECAMTDGGRKATVSLWYNGDSLVMMETRGSSVVKRKLTVTDGATLQMDVVSIVPQGKTGKLVFTKQS
jgi:hypothetical protein